MADPISQQGLYQDGNSIFENVHILGTLEVTGIVTSTTTVSASKFIGDGSELTGIDATTIKDSTGTTQIQGTITGATHSGRAVFNEVEITGKLYDGVTGQMGSAGKVLSSTGSQLEWINTSAANVGSATNVGVNIDSTDASQFISFFGASSGNQPNRVNNSLRYNPSTNTIGAINIASAVITGNLQINGQLKDGDGNFGGSGTVLTSDGTDTKWDNVGNLAAGSAAKVSVSEDDTETDGRLLFSNAAGQSGGNVVKSDNDLTYNANTNTLTVTNITGTASAATQAANLNNHDTDDLSEGSTNEYFTNSRARAAISVGTEGSPSGDGSISYNNSTGVLTFTPAAAAGTPTAITVADESSDTTCFPLFATATTGDLAPKTGSNLTFNSSSGTLGATAFSGSGASLSSLNADNLSSGSLPSARLSGTYSNTVTIGSVRIGAWTGDNAYKGIYHTSQGGAAYMIMSNNTATFISASPSQPVYIRYGSNDSTNQLVIGSGNDALTWRGNKIMHAGNYGELLRSNADDTCSGKITFTKNQGSNYDTIATSTGSQGAIEIFNTGAGNDAFMTFHAGGDFAFYFGLDADTNDLSVGGWSMGANKYRVWHAGNDGLNSGLDADVLRGAAPNVSASNNTIVQRHSSGYIFANYFNTTPNDVSSGITKICCETSNDGYIRHATSAGVKSFLGLTGGTFSRTIVRAYGSNATYTPTSGTKSIQVYCIAGGGGGGNATGDDSGEQSDFGAASGGGGGGCAIGHYQLTGSFSASIQIGGGGGGSSGGGESRFTPSGSYTGNNTIQGDGGGGAGSNASNGAGGGGASGGFNLTGHQGNNRSTSSSGGQYFQTPGNGGVAGFVFGTFGSGGNGAGPTGSNATGQSGTAGVVVVYEYINA